MIPSPQHLLTAPGPLLDAQGNLTGTGWARQPLLDCNLENVRFPKWRVKTWDYYGITTPTHFFSFTLGDIGYLGSIFAYVIEFATGAYQEETLTIPLGRGISLARNSTEGESLYDNGRVRLHFEIENGERHISVRWPEFGGDYLEAEAVLRPLPEHESMVVVIPIKGKRFYYNRKVNCIPASGWVDYKEEIHHFDPQTCLGNLDWGRGVWEFKSFWVWASASGFLTDGRSLGLNLGFGFGDTSAATENALVLDGRIHKLAQVDFTYDPANFKNPWTMRSPDGRLDLTFVPFAERVAKTDFKLLSSEVHQLFGAYFGTAVTDEDETLIIENLVGFAEEHHAKW